MNNQYKNLFHFGQIINFFTDSLSFQRSANPLAGSAVCASITTGPTRTAASAGTASPTGPVMPVGAEWGSDGQMRFSLIDYVAYSWSHFGGCHSIEVESMYCSCKHTRRMLLNQRCDNSSCKR